MGLNVEIKDEIRKIFKKEYNSIGKFKFCFSVNNGHVEFFDDIIEPEKTKSRIDDLEELLEEIHDMSGNY